MLKRALTKLVAGLLPGLLCLSTVLAQGLDDRALIEALRDGGYSIYFRHQATDWSQDDHVINANDWLSCDGAKIRQLSDAGREAARATGEAMRRLGIKVSRVIASPYCRTMETARLLGFGVVEPSTDVMNLRVAHFFGGAAAIVKTARGLLARSVEKGANVVIVAHGNVAREATPVYPAEGEAVIFRAGGEDGFEFIGRLTAAQWIALTEVGR